MISRFTDRFSDKLYLKKYIKSVQERGSHRERQVHTERQRQRDIHKVVLLARHDAVGQCLQRSKHRDFCKFKANLSNGKKPCLKKSPEGSPGVWVERCVRGAPRALPCLSRCVRSGHSVLRQLSVGLCTFRSWPASPLWHLHPMTQHKE